MVSCSGAVSNWVSMATFTACSRQLPTDLESYHSTEGTIAYSTDESWEEKDIINQITAFLSLVGLEGRPIIFKETPSLTVDVASGRNEL